MLFRAPNRTRGAWWVLLFALILPLLTNYVLERAGILQMTAFLSESVHIFFFAIAFLWLTADTLGNLGRMSTMVYAAGVLVLAGLIGLLCVSGLRFENFLVATGLGYIIAAGATVVSLALAGVCCRKRYSPRRFSIWFFVILVPGIGGAATFLVFLLALLARMLTFGRISSWYVQYLFREYMTIGIAGGLALFFLLLPFMILAFKSKAYRPRFHAIFRLPGMMEAEQDNNVYSSRSMGDQES